MLGVDSYINAQSLFYVPNVKSSIVSSSTILNGYIILQ